MTDQHQRPITPPTELVKQWEEDWHFKVKDKEFGPYMAERGAQWGADQELEACCEVLQQKGVPAWSLLRLNRRPTPPSLKEQALSALNGADQGLNESAWQERLDIIRRALEALPND